MILTMRMKNLLDKIIPHGQFAIPGRQISDLLLMMRDICDQEKNARNKMLLALDFEKAFDLVDITYLLKVLRKNGFGCKFLELISSVYKEMDTRILLNGYLSPVISVQRGIRQGDPLSLFMFVIAIHPLLTFIHNNESIKGIFKPGNTEIKYLAYADDVTLMLNKESSVHEALRSVELLQQATGMLLNETKTKWIKLGQRTTSITIPFQEEKIIKILGIFFANRDTTMD